MITAIKEITYQEDGLTKVQFPTNDAELVNFIKNNHPKSHCILKHELHSGISPSIKSGVQHECWVFSNKDDSVDEFISQLIKGWGFKTTNESNK